MTDFYLDFTAAPGGTGTFASPWYRLSDIAGTAAGDIVWLRRVTFTDTTLSPDYAASIPDSIPIVGWPLAGDTRFATRPAAAQAAWDGDAGQYAMIDHTPVGTSTIGTELSLTSFRPASRTYVLSRFRLRRVCAGGSIQQGAVGFFGQQAATYITCAFITERCSFEVVQGTSTAGGLYCIGCSTGPGVSSQYANFTWTDTASAFVATSTAIPAVIIMLAGSGSGGYDITTTLTAAFTLSTISISGPSASYPVYCAGAVARCNLNGVFDRVTFSHSQARTSTDFWQTKPTSLQGIYFVRCIFTGLSGGTNGFNRFVTHNYTYYECDFINFNSIQINDAGAGLSIRRFVQGAVDSTRAAIDIPLGGSYLTVGYASFVTGTLRDVSFGAPFDSIGSGTVHFRSVVESGAGYLLNYNGRVIAQNINGAVGTYKRSTLVGTAQSVPSYRTGGARYAIQLVPASTNAAQVEGCPTEEPGFETLKFALPAGACTVTMYCAHVGYSTAPTTASVWAEVEAPQAATRLRVSTRDTTGVALTADTSNWNGVAGSPVKFKLVLSITSSDQVVAAVRVYAGAGGGSVFVDPKVIVS